MLIKIGYNYVHNLDILSYFNTSSATHYSRRIKKKSFKKIKTPFNL